MAWPAIVGMGLLLIGLGHGTLAHAEDTGPIEQVIRAAEHGDGEAQYRLAQRYGTGEGVERDPERALMWMLRAAESGHLEAQAGLGLHFTGEGQDAAAQKLGKIWLTRAAERRHPIAAMQLGVMAVDAGQGAQALPWFRIAADSGDRDIQRAFSDMLEKGDGVPRDEAEAYYWYLVAAPPDRVETAEETALGRRLGARTADAMAVKADAWRARLPDGASVALPTPPSARGLTVPDHVAGEAGDAASGFFEVTHWDYPAEGDERPPIARRQRFDLRDAIAYRARGLEKDGAAVYTVLEITSGQIDRASVLAELHDNGARSLFAGLSLHVYDDGTLRAGLVGSGLGYQEIRREVVESELQFGPASVSGRVRTKAPESDSDWRNYRFDVHVHAARIDVADAEGPEPH